MRVIIAGAGEVGTRVGEELDANHEVVMIDKDTDQIDRLGYDLDVLPVTGDSSSIETLRKAEVEAADVLVASTDSDEINIITCGTAKAISDVTTVARVKDAKYIETWDQAEGAFDVDLMVGTNLLTVATAVGGTGLSAARSFDVFAGGTVHMAEFEIRPDSSLAGQTVREADRFEALTVAAIIRAGRTVIPTGSTRIEAGDGLVVIGEPESVLEIGSDLGHRNGNTRNILVVGGSDIGYQTARLLEDRGLRPHLTVADADRARELSERLPGTTVRQGDPTDRRFLERERMADVDVVVAALHRDSETNLLAALRGKQLGADQSVAIVDHGEHVELFEGVGVDVAVDPRRATAKEIIQFVRDQDTRNVAVIEQAQIVEIRIAEESDIAGERIDKAIDDLPSGVVIGAITRDGSFVVPRGDTVIHSGDHVVVFVDSDVIEETMKRL